MSKTMRFGGFIFDTLVCSHTTAYDICVCQRMITRLYTQIYVRGTHTSCTFLIRWHTSMYVVIRRGLNNFLDMFKIFQRMRAYR